MRRPSLSALLITGNAGLVLVAVGLIAWEASGLLRAISDERGLSRAREAAAAAARAVAAGAPVEPALAAAAQAGSGARAIFVPKDAGLAGDQERDELRARALSSGEAVGARIGGQGPYVAAAPVRAPGGGVSGLVEVDVPAGPIDAALQARLRILIGLSLVVVMLVIVGSAVIARAITRPLASLTDASVRMGREDFATPVPLAPGAEMGALAEAMEEMRGRLSRSTAELHRLHTGAEAVLAGVVEGVFAVDRERRLRYLNPQTTAMLGLDAKASIGRFCGDVLRPREADGGRPCEERCPIVHARFLGSARATESLLASDGRRRMVVITSAAPSLSEPGGGPEGEQQFQVMRDETELEATRRLRDTILANISHEFRTPLAAQLASIELLRDRLAALTPDETRSLLLSLERGTMRLTQLIDNLLESVRIESGRLSIRRQPLALDEVVEEAVAMTSHLLAQRRQEIVVDLPYPLPPVEGDAPRLTQVFVNLLANAHKFAPEGTTIRIGGGVAGDEVALWVEDQGPGLPPGGEAEIFRRFYRSPGEEPSESGLGLGLWIVKSIVERHRGRVEALRAEGGSGTRMCVVLPREDARGAPEERPVRPERA
jgi:signal transduction histidine kinase/HAMP domain-containing protein